MIAQSSLFDVEPAVRELDPQTSHDAARAPGLNRQRRDVLATLVRFGPATAYEIAITLQPIQQNVVARRLDDLRDLGFAEPTEQTRPGSSTRHLRVWRATTQGQEAIA